MVNKKRRLNKLRSWNHPRPPTRAACDVRVIPLGSLAVLPTGVLLRFGEGGRFGNDIRLIRIVVRGRIVIGGRIIPVGIVVKVPSVSAEVDAGPSVEMSSAIVSAMSTIIPTISYMPAVIPSVPARPSGSSTTISLCLIRCH
jgi:hypothetical protein